MANPMAAGIASASSTLASVDRSDGKKDPVPSFAFHVEINGIVEASFTACSGLSVTREVTPIKEGGVNDGVTWLHTGLSYGKITLQSGIAYSTALWNWFYTGAQDGKVQYKTVSILQKVPYTQTTARRYDLVDCMATGWTGPSLDTGTDNVAIESLEIAFKRFTVTAGPS